ncbi:MAG: hypothetical protein BWY45_00353 [Euryarchaeota archaeon ADurb.Bin294]|nr:MAG: hypothetical protein BWY45_00353 [Euryarchaeota archaeon ADurb.Bin294]
MTKAIVKNNTLIMQDSLHIPDGEEVEVIVRRFRVIDDMYGAFRISDPKIIEDLAESENFE